MTGRPQTPPEDDLVLIGIAGRAHGVHGAIWIRPTGPTLARLAQGAELLVLTRDGQRRRLVVDSVHTSGGRCRLTLAGVETRDQATALAAAEVHVSTNALAPHDQPDTFYARDLIGLSVYSGDHLLGTVRVVHPGPANDALEITTEQGLLLVPFTADAILSLDLGARRLDVRPDLLPTSED